MATDAGDVELTAATDSVKENDDLVTEILRRLPLKPLTRSKSVSKRWLSLISDLQPSLIFKPTSALFLQSLRFNPEFAFVPLDAAADISLDVSHFQVLSQPNTRILHSSNGLVCYSKFGLYSDVSLLEYYVCNPTTKSSAKIPLQATVRNRRIRWGHFRFQHKLCNPRSHDLDIHFLGVYLAFDDPKSTHYRVVCVAEFNADLFNYEIKIAVLNPEEEEEEGGLWSEPMGPFTVPYGTCFTNGVFWNGGMFWVSKKEIVCFHINQVFLKVAGLPLDSSGAVVEYFGVSRGHLQLVVSERHQRSVLKVFEMQQDYSGWVMQYRCDLQPLMDERVLNKKRSCSFTVVFVGQGEEGEGARLVLGLGGEVVCYNLMKKRWKKLCDFPSIHRASSVCFRVFPYDETLFQV